MSNPFFEEWQTPYGIPPFDRINDQHFEPAFDQGFEAQREEINAITANPAMPTFANTVEALEASGRLLDKVGAVFFNLASSDTNPDRQALEMTVSEKWSNHTSDLYGNERLFARIEHLYKTRITLELASDQLRLLDDMYQNFVRGGAGLGSSEKAEVRKLNAQLAQLETQFSQNILKDTNDFELILDREQLLGLPESVRAAAATEAEARGHSDSFAFTISRSSITPFLQFSEDRELRQHMYEAYTRCGDNDNDANNRAVLSEIAELRQQRAHLMGFETHADFMLDDRMAANPGNVHQLLDQIWSPAQKKVHQEATDLQNQIQQDGQNFKLAPHDWWYYTEKLRSERFDLSDNDIKPYFELSRVRDGAFEVANQLFGISFSRINDLPLYHPDVEAYAVTDADGSEIGLFLADYFSRSSKRDGAWMSEFRGQAADVRPIIVNCCNFAKSAPCLLNLDEVSTLFHEFGHGLHGLMSQVRYASQAGTNVKQDFVELPSQIMEHWAIEPEVLRSYARHIETGQVITDELIAKILETQTFNQGFMTTEYLAASYLDLAWHQNLSDAPINVDTVEHQAMDNIGLIDTVAPRYKSTYFQHIFSGDDYSAGYYSYIWAEVLDADGFEAFKENGIFDPATAKAFRENILERGGSDDPMALYRAFRGRDPEVHALLRNRGLVQSTEAA
jgi:peptidyl-dipeptidase Dcp